MLIFRHYCQCKPGFKAYQDPSLDGAIICIDENECDLGTHTCHPNAQCWNTAGSYQCYCGYDASQNCSSGMYSLSNLVTSKWKKFWCGFLLKYWMDFQNLNSVLKLWYMAMFNFYNC